MSTTITLYHNPTCSKSRAALALLHEHGVVPQVVRYLENPPTFAELEGLLARLGLEPRELMRPDEPEYAALGLGDPQTTRAELIAALASHPNLLQRPLALSETKAVVARPPERVLELL